MHKFRYYLPFAIILLVLFPTIAQDATGSQSVKSIQTELYKSQIDVFVQFKKDSIFDKILKEAGQHPLQSFQPESLSTVSQDLLDFNLKCVCGLKIGYYLLSVKVITDTLGHPFELSIPEIADPCCTMEEVRGLLDNKVKRLTIYYYKEINNWAIRKK